MIVRYFLIHLFIFNLFFLSSAAAYQREVGRVEVDLDKPLLISDFKQDNLEIHTPTKVNDEVLRWGVCRLYMSVEGGMGALFATIAGLLAVIFAIVGAFKAAWGFLLVAVGAFILRSLVSLFYGGDFNNCRGDGQIASGFDRNIEVVSNFSNVA